MAPKATKRRGRPRREESQSEYTGALSNQVREAVKGFVKVCDSCGHTIRPIQPLAQAMGIAPAIVAGFIKGERGVSMETLDKLWGYVQQHQNDPVEGEAEAAPASA